MTEFVQAVDPSGKKRWVPDHYLQNPALVKQGFKLPPSARVTEPATTAGAQQVTEPAAADTTATTVEEPAAATPKTIKRTAAGGETKEA